MPVPVVNSRMQIFAQVKKRLRSTEVGTKNHGQEDDFQQEDVFSHLNEDFKVQGTERTRKIEKIIFDKNHHFGLISHNFSPKTHEIRENEKVENPHKLGERKVSPPKWHRKCFKPPEWVYMYLKVWSRKQPDYRGIDRKSRVKHEEEWWDPTSLIFEEAHTGSVRICSAWTKESNLCIISAISEKAKKIWKKAVAYLCSAQIPFAALLLTKEVKEHSFVNMQVIEMIGTSSPSTQNTFSFVTCYTFQMTI